MAVFTGAFRPGYCFRFATSLFIFRTKRGNKANEMNYSNGSRDGEGGGGREEWRISSHPFTFIIEFIISFVVEVNHRVVWKELSRLRWSCNAKRVERVVYVSFYYQFYCGRGIGERVVGKNFSVVLSRKEGNKGRKERFRTKGFRKITLASITHIVF